VLQGLLENCTMSRRSIPASGMSLWELLTVLAVIATLLGLAVPSFRAWQLDARRVGDVNALVSAIQLARSEAAKRGRPAVLCPSLDASSCASPGTAFDRGWIVFINEDDVRPPNRDAADPLLWAYVPLMNGSIRSNRHLYEFRPFTWRSTNGTVTFCDDRGASQARAVIVSYTGRPRIASNGPGRPLQCA
jgi:type IV fimbrial biogenesis protein FimT